MLKITTTYPINIKILRSMKPTLKSLNIKTKYLKENQREFLKNERGWWNRIMPFQKPNINILNFNNRLIAIKLITKVVNKIKIIMKINLIILIK